MGQAEDAGLLQGPFVLFAFSSKWGEISLLQVPLEQVASSAKDAATRYSRMDGLRQTFTLRLIRVKVSPMLVSSRIGWGVGRWLPHERPGTSIWEWTSGVVESEK